MDQRNTERRERGDAGQGNRLAGEKSPYLLQHAGNPVDWHPWGEEALRRAEQENKPVFLSIGYATCHWCHVMAHESFEDAEVARVLNRDFVSIKVDREERPDVDMIYMNACQVMTRGGGWPLTVFMTPDGKPIFAGTYFPRTSRMWMPGFLDLAGRIAHLWKQDPQRLARMGEEVVRAIEPSPETQPGASLPGPEVLQHAFEHLRGTFDTRWGGFGPAPKFPLPHNLLILLRWHQRSKDPDALKCVEKTLQAMRNGGIFDQIGFGFHRYSVDERWLVPHFEKMLYDQAQMAMACVEAYQATGRSRYEATAREVFTYVLRDMTSPEGGFYSAEDADSEGREGLFYVWKPGEIRDVLGRDDGDIVCRFYGIVPGGNFEDGLSIPHVQVELEAFARAEGMPAGSLLGVLEQAREKLFQVRCGRVHPLKDDKVLASWNGLMIAALARGARAMGEPAYTRAAKRAATFVLERLAAPGGGLLRRYREGEAAVPGYADDYAFLIRGLIELYEATFEAPFLRKALDLQACMVERFWDQDGGGFFFSGTENESLVVRSKEAYDQAVPSSNSVAASNLLRLARLTGDASLEERAEATLRTFARSVEGFPAAYTFLLLAVDHMIGPSQEIVLAGDPKRPETAAMIREVHERFLPRAALLLNPPGASGNSIRSMAPFLAGMVPGQAPAAAFVCERFTCHRPLTDPEALRQALKG